MSTGTNPQANAQVIEQERRRLSARLDEVARLCEGTLPPGSFYTELLQRLLESLAAVAGTVWIRTQAGNLQQQSQINMPQVGLDSDEVRAAHDMLLRFAFTNPQNLHLPPRSVIGAPEDGKSAPGNLTQYMLLLVPIKQNDQVIGLLEVFQGPNRPAAAVPGFLQYMALMADLGSRYQRNQLVGQLVGQQALWAQLETFARQIHSSLNPIEVSFHVASEGRRLIDCDRVSVANRRGGVSTKIEAVSGCDTVEKRSNQVRLMQKLADAVLNWGERLVYSGSPDASLPPKVLTALDAYLTEQPSKLLVVEPLRPERDPADKEKEKDKPKQPVRSALIMECFETPSEVPQTMARLDVVSRHSAGALHNAIQHHRIPLRWIWMPLAKLQEGLGGKTKAITMAVVAAVSIIITGLIFIPYPLKVESSGNLVPVVRCAIFTPVPGQIKGYNIAERETNIAPERSLIRMYDSTLDSKMRELGGQIEAAQKEADELETQARTEPNPQTKAEKNSRAILKRFEQRNKQGELAALMDRTQADPTRIGHFNLKAPKFTPQEDNELGQGQEKRIWTVLNSGFRDQMPLERTVQPNEPIIRLGAVGGRWEIELKIPQKHVGQVLRAFKKNGDKPLDVDFILLGNATTKYRGKLERHKISSEAVPDTETVAGQEPEPVVMASVSLDHPDIAQADRIERYQLVASSGIRAKVICGDYPSGYSLFYGVWEFLYEKVVFFLF